MEVPFLYIQSASSFDALYMLASQEVKRVKQPVVVQNVVKGSDDVIGLSMDGSPPAPTVTAEWRVTPRHFLIPVKEEPDMINSGTSAFLHGSSQTSYVYNPSVYYPVYPYGYPYSKQ